MIFVLAPLCNTPLGGYVPEIFRGLHHQLPQLDKAAVKVKKEANKVLGVLQKLPKERLVALLSRNGPICPWSALYASKAPSPGVNIHKKTLSASNTFSVVLRALFVTITIVPVALIQCCRTWVGKILRHVGRSLI